MNVNGTQYFRGGNHAFSSPEASSVRSATKQEWKHILGHADPSSNRTRTTVHWRKSVPARGKTECTKAPDIPQVLSTDFLFETGWRFRNVRDPNLYGNYDLLIRKVNGLNSSDSQTITHSFVVRSAKRCATWNPTYTRRSCISNNRNACVGWAGGALSLLSFDLKTRFSFQVLLSRSSHDTTIGRSLRLDPLSLTQSSFPGSSTLERKQLLQF